MESLSSKRLSDYFKKYNLGCGTSLFTDFLNIGYWSDLEPTSIYRDLNGTTNTYMLNYDLRQGIPAMDNSLSLVYHSHMLEHLTYSEGIDFIRECFRVLESGGKMRILVPDLELWINSYVGKNRFFFDQYRKVLDGDIYVTNASIFMGMLHNHGHKCGYDYETLKWMLEYCGFANVTKTLYGDSSISNISNMEPQIPLRVMESLCVECCKN